MPQIVVPTRTKQPDEIRTLTFNFESKLAQNDAITGSPTVTKDDGIDIITTQVSGNLVTLRISGGQDQNNYKINVGIATDLGDFVELDVIIRVRDGYN